MDEFFKKIERILELPYYSYNYQNDLSRLNPPPPVSIFGNSKLGRLIKSAGEAWGLYHTKNAHGCPSFSGGKQKKKPGRKGE